MSTYPHPWALCGGWAIDAWLGRVTREHGDIDIVVFEADQLAALHHLRAAGWHLIAHDEAVGQATRDLWDGRPLVLPAHIHCAMNLDALLAWVPSGGRTPGELYLEAMVNEHSGADWVLSSEPSLAVPATMWRRESPWGLPTAAPEVLLFYKATAYVDRAIMASRNPKDEADFRAFVPHLSPDGRAWLYDAVATLHPNHAWLPLLSEWEPSTETA